MTLKERILFSALAALVVLGIGYAIVNSVLLTPMAHARKSIETGRVELDRLERANAVETKLRRDLETLLGRTYTGRLELDPAETQRLSSARLRELALACGLEESTLDLRQASGRTSPGEGGFLQVGWTLSAKGTLEQVVDFLYRVANQDCLQRIENLSLRPDLATGRVDVGFKYYTLTLLAQKASEKQRAEQSLDPEKIPAPPIPALDDPARRELEGIVTRDLLRPYIRKEPPPPAPTTPDEPEQPERPAPPPAPRTDQYFSIVGLPSFSNDPARASVLVCDSRNGSVKEYRPGDEFGGGEIALVDYRPMPAREHPEVVCTARVVIRREDGCYALELGASIPQAWKMTPDELPESLQAAPTGEEGPDGDGDDEAASEAVEQPLGAAGPDDSGIPDELRDFQGETSDAGEGSTP